MGSQPIRIQLGKILWENLVGKSCRNILWEILWENLVGNLVGNSCRKFLWENLAGNCCGKILQEKEKGKIQFKKGSDWWKFSI